MIAPGSVPERGGARPGATVAVAVAGIAFALSACVGAPPVAVAPAELPTVEDLVLPDLAATSVERQVQEVTVRVRSLGCEQLGIGSGFVLPDGLVVTNRHVVDAPVEVTVNTWDGRRLTAEVVGVSPDSDLAVLQLEDPGGIPVARLREDPVVRGEPVHVVGYPGGGPATVSSGEVLGTADGRLLGEPADIIRVDAEIQLGNSGGPLVDADGHVIGIVFAVESTQGTGLVVPVETLVERLDLEDLEPPPGC